ncbi:MAG: hypothetical protein DHS80DRAFT_20886 [Piptocephalis tieghemiana]|nr:MAG: hypothetical protein DHS80DRAFT_20886 [Piptocephalis tieghemiana]
MPHLSSHDPDAPQLDEVVVAVKALEVQVAALDERLRWLSRHIDQDGEYMDMSEEEGEEREGQDRGTDGPYTFISDPAQGTHSNSTSGSQQESSLCLSPTTRQNPTGGGRVVRRRYRWSLWSPWVRRWARRALQHTLLNLFLACLALLIAAYYRKPWALRALRTPRRSLHLLRLLLSSSSSSSRSSM